MFARVTAGTDSQRENTWNPTAACERCNLLACVLRDRWNRDHPSRLTRAHPSGGVTRLDSRDDRCAFAAVPPSFCRCSVLNRIISLPFPASVCEFHARSRSIYVGSRISCGGPLSLLCCLAASRDNQGEKNQKEAFFSSQVGCSQGRNKEELPENGRVSLKE